MWVKICANTSAEDAVKAAEFGADAVGFVFAPSSRQMTPAQVREISAAMPEGVERIGVFGDIGAEAIALAADTAKLTAVQLHGGFNRLVTERLAELLAPDVSVIQTVHWNVGADAGGETSRIEDELQEIAACGGDARILIDAKVGVASGGTGVAFDWSSAARVLSSQPGLRVIVAGGLRPDNVGEAINALRPWGVDVASGVESAPGRKDSAKLKQFIENARRA